MLAREKFRHEMSYFKYNFSRSGGNVTWSQAHEWFRNATNHIEQRKLLYNLTEPPTDTETMVSRPVSKMVIVGITLATLTILLNFLLVVIIVTSKELRRKPFFWNILSLCISDLVVGTFVIPIGLDYLIERTWSYGQDLCKVWSVTDLCHFSLSALVLVSICIDRLQTKLQSVTPISTTTTRAVSVALTSLPWCFLFAVCLPILIIGERNVHFEFSLNDSSCVFLLLETYFVPSITVMYVLPATILFLVVFAMLFVYHVKGGTWDRLPANISDTEKASLRMSTIATWVVSLMTVTLWLPYIVLVYIYLTCERDSWCRPDQATNASIYSLSLTTSAITPCLWLILTEVRQTIKLWICPIFTKIRAWFGVREESPNAQWEYHTELLGDNEL